MSGRRPAGDATAAAKYLGIMWATDRSYVSAAFGLEAEIFRAAGGVVQTGTATPSDRLLDCELTDRGLRFGMERSYRALARLAPARSARVGLVDLGNEIRPGR